MSKITIDFSRTMVVLILVSLAVGYLAGNTFPFSPTASPTSSGTTTGQVQPPTQQQQTSKVQVSIDDDPKLGNANAPVTVIEFSDFQCPFCRRSYTDMLPQLKQEYVDTGKVLFVYRDFPLSSIHPAATPAALAAECADDQGKFWDYHNKIFDEQNKQGQGTIQFSVDDLKTWAVDIGLNTATFNSCLDSQKYKSEVEKDFQDGATAGVSGTPTFFIGNSRDGYTAIVGAQPYAVIKQEIEDALA